LKGSSVGKRGRPTTQKKKKKISESHSDKAHIIEKYRLSSIKKNLPTLLRMVQERTRGSSKETSQRNKREREMSEGEKDRL
jgi:hypothetical protein